MAGNSRLRIPRFFGLDLKTNLSDVRDGVSIGAENCFQNGNGTISKFAGSESMFSADETASITIDEIGSATLGSTKYYFKFSNGVFSYATSLVDVVTVITPSPAISTINLIWFAVLDSKLFFVDGTNVLRYFDGTNVVASAIYARPTVALTSASGAGAFTYIYTVDNGRGESPAVATLLPSIVSAATIRVTGNTGPQTLIAGDVVRIYSRADTIAAASKLVKTYTWLAADVTAGFSDVVTVAISDTQSQLYSELGLALNVTAPTAFVGLIEHYGRLVAWKGDRVYNSKSSNPHSWPSDQAQKEAFVYGFGVGDGEGVQVCASYLESLFVFKKTKLAVFGGIGPDDTGNNAYSFRRVETNGNGCSAPKSAVVVGDETKNYMVYRSQSGFYATNGDKPVRIGEKIESAVNSESVALQLTSVAFHHKKLGLYYCFTGGPTARIAWVLDIREDQGTLVGWFQRKALNAKCVAWDGDRFLWGSYTGFCASERAATGLGTNVNFQDIQVEYVAPASVTTGTDIITVVNSYQTNDIITFRSTGAVPTGLIDNIPYFAIRISATSIKVAATAGGAAIDLTTQGTGTISLLTYVPINAFYITNWFNFGSPARVKKLMKPSILLNVDASSGAVSTTMTSAYDWVNSYSDSQSISITTAAAGVTARNVSISRRKCRSVSYKFANAVLRQDVSLQGLEQDAVILRNRGNYA